MSANLEHCRAVVNTLFFVTIDQKEKETWLGQQKDKHKDISGLVTHSMLTIPDKLRNSNHKIEGQWLNVREWPGQHLQFLAYFWLIYSYIFRYTYIFYWKTYQGVWSSASSVNQSSSALCLLVWSTRRSSYIYWWYKLRFDLLEVLLRTRASLLHITFT